MRDVQSFGQGFQTSKFNDLCPLQGRDRQGTSGVFLPLIGEQSDEPEVPIPLAGSPEAGFVAVELGSEVFAPPACDDPQNHSSTPDLIPGRRTTGSDRFQLNDVWREDRQHFGLASDGRIATVNRLWCTCIL